MNEERKLSGASASAVRAGVTEAAAGNDLELTEALGSIPPDELDLAVKVSATVTERLRKLRAAHATRAEAVRIVKTNVKKVYDEIGPPPGWVP